MPRIEEIKVYKFDELEPSAQDRAVERFADTNDYWGWWDAVFEDAEQVASLLGITLHQRSHKLVTGGTGYSPEIRFTGIDGNDGCSFAGDYRYQKGAVNAVKEYAPQDKELHRIAKVLQEAQRRCFYAATASIRPMNREDGVRVDIEYEPEPVRSLPDGVGDEIGQALQDFNGWIFSQLRGEHDYLTSREAIVETIKANEYEFTEDGEQWGRL
jgi:hypothetical protein